MPRKTNKRKAIQKAKVAAQPKPKARHIGTIAHLSAGTVALAMAVLASTLAHRAVWLDADTDAAIFDDLDSLYDNDKETHHD